VPESATVSTTRVVTVAAGVYAPGHLGELTQYLPFELVDDVLAATGTVQRRLRELPSWQVPGLMEAIKPGGTSMVAPRKYPEELRERSIRLALDARKSPASRAGACRRIGEQLGINPETLRGWVSQAEVDAGTRTGTTTADAVRLAELEREVRELRRANAILRSASAFFAAELDRPSR
jgi:transposase